MKSDNQQELEFDLAFNVHHLLHGEPFYARISRNMRKVPNYKIQTIGVRFNEETMNFELMYNPKMMVQLSKQHCKAVLMHEFNHCILGHITDRLPIDSSIFSDGKIDQKNQQILNRWNIATDCAINSLPNMKQLFEGIEWNDVVPNENGHYCKCSILMPGSDCERFRPEDPNYTEEQKKERQKMIDMLSLLSEKQSAEWYMKNLPEEIGKDGGHGDHDQWAIASAGDKAIQEAIKRIAKQKMKDAVQKAFDEANKSETEGGNGWGSISHDMRRKISELIKPKLDPKKVLRYFVKTSVISEERNSITKINRKWGYIHPGRRYDEVANVAISIDMSGSVSDEMLKKFFGWLNSLSKFATFTVIPFDSEVFENKVYVWKKGERKPIERVLSGGTDFDAPTKWVNKRKFDGHIVITDMCAPKPIRSKCQRMWITTQSCAQSKYFDTNERILVVD